MRWGNVDFRQLEELRDKIQNIEEKQNEFCRAAAKELAARLLREVIKRTPVGQYEAGSGMTGGTLRRGWTGDTNGGGAYANALPVSQVGNSFVIDIINPTEYAAYVEFGHRTRGGGGWVPGRFMLTESEIRLNSQASQIIEKKLQKWLEGELR